jgi:hypothetical protein
MPANDIAARKQLVVDLLDAYQHQGRKMAVDPRRVHTLISADLDLTAVVFEDLLKFNRAADARIWGLLAVVASLYKIATGGDDSLSVLLQKAAQADGVQLPNITSVVPQQAAAINQTPAVKPQAPETVFLEIAHEDIAAGDAYRMQSVMSLDRLDDATRTRLVGHCVLQFPVPQDPRPPARIPEVRAFVADLHRRLPYFPLYFDFSPEHQMHLIYFGCLADLEAIETHGNKFRVRLEHDSVANAVARTVIGTRIICQRLHWDWEPFARSIAAVYDADAVERLIETTRNISLP